MSDVVTGIAGEATPPEPSEDRSAAASANRGGRFGTALANTTIFYYAAIWLFVLLIVGTLAQADIGLYMAQEKYFSSWVIFTGPLPLPGGRLTMGLIVVNLLAKFIFKQRWRWNYVGTIISHVGAMLLFAGGFLTAVFATEGSMVIAEGGISSAVEDYHQVELAIIDASDPQFDDVVAYGPRLFQPGSSVEIEGTSARLKILAYHRNAGIMRRATPSVDADYKGFAKNFQMSGLALNNEHELNRAAMMLRVVGAGAADGVYLMAQGQPVPTEISVGGKAYRLEVRRERRQLPFSIELIDFEKKLHAGTGMAKSYKSVVNLIEDGGSRRVVIQMNEPLRHKGRTFFQASFMETPNGDSTVLAVVDNVGHMFPYISSIIICIGLLIHLLMSLPRLIRRRRETV